jgi:hypothetical protein
MKYEMATPTVMGDAFCGVQGYQKGDNVDAMWCWCMTMRC